MMDPKALLEGDSLGLGRLCDPRFTVCGFRDSIFLSFAFFFATLNRAASASRDSPGSRVVGDGPGLLEGGLPPD